MPEKDHLETRMAICRSAASWVGLDLRLRL